MQQNSERTYRTSANEGYSTFVEVTDIECRLKKIATTDEGAVAISIELAVNDDATLEKIRDLIRVQQGQVRISVQGVQGELPL